MKRLSFFSLFLLLITATNAQKALTDAFDKLLSQQFPASGTGAAAIVVKNGKIVYHKGFGMADLENKIAMKPEMVFRIGSISKQFTAVAILQLMEQGKLGLQDELIKYIPDYPVAGNKITIENLLTHTAGIPNYTDMKEFSPAFQHTDMTPEQIIASFKSKPLEFKPGEKWKYSNSGYILLGYIIEKITGRPYSEYVEQNLFKPAGMQESLYGSNSKIIINRADGYQPADSGVVNADYMSMTVPFAAGSLMSTVLDLSKWNQAIHSYKLLKKETLEKAFTGYTLTNGKNCNYGYGWSIGDVDGKKVIEHGGGINGYLTNALYVPAGDLFVAVFSNCTCQSPDNVSHKITELALGIVAEKKALPTDSVSLKKYEGVFENDPGELRELKVVGNQLTSQRQNSKVFNIFMYEKNKFFFDGSPATMEFVTGNEEKVTGLSMKQGYGPAELWKKTGKKMPDAPEEIAVDEKILNSYIGEYQLAPEFIITVSVKEKKLVAQATGQPAFELFAKTEDKFFLKVVKAEVDFVKDASGKVTHLILHQNGADVEGEKIK